MGAFERTPSRNWSPQLQAGLVRNTVEAYRDTTPKQRHLGAQFYPDWNEDAQYLGQQMGHATHEHASAMIARLSPQTEAEMNRMMGYQTLHMDDVQTRHVTDSATFSQEALKHPKGSPERAALTKRSGELRAKAGIVGTPLGNQSSGNIARSLSHREGTNPNPLDTLGEVKISDFGHTIHNPAHVRQTVDTHYHDAMHGRTDIPYDMDRGLGAKGRYEEHQTVAGLAYHRSAEQGLVDPEKTTPNGFMGGVWYHQQQTKANNNPAASKSRKASDSRLRNLMANPRSAEWDPAKHGQRPVLSHIDF